MGTAISKEHFLQTTPPNLPDKERAIPPPLEKTGHPGVALVMALLQAARAKALGYPLDEAESFGLNRAIFYAAAKRGFKGGSSSKHPGEQHVLRETPGRNISKTIQQDALGDEVAYYVEMDGKKRYVMGEEILEPDDFKRQVAERFGQAFPQAWEQALQIVEQTDRATLESRRKFYEEVYKPRRDVLAKAWSALSKQAS